MVVQAALPLQFAAKANPIKVANARLNKKRLDLWVGETFQLKVKDVIGKVEWSTSNKRIATVSKKGLVKAKKKGNVKITAKVGFKSLVCKVTVHKTSYPVHTPILKPIIYLYPETETELSVTLGKPENITVSYPAYGDGWHVLAQPDGTLVDLETGRHLYALYWEGKNGSALPMDEGFVVAGADTAAFLEEKLALLGLSEREAEEFIVYWLPTLQENAYNLIRFETRAEIEDYMPLKLSMEPDTLIRVMMRYRPLEEALEVPEQVLPQTPERKGFTVVEWGGTKAD